MAIVDLRGREHEPEVRVLIEPQDGWMLIGWSRDDRLVACAAVERADDDELAVRAIAADEDADVDRLLDAIAGVATAARLVADVELSIARRCGFVEVDGRLVRELATRPARDESVTAVTLHEFEAAIRAAWSRDTSDDPDEWTEDNPARGQCGVTALLVRELLGGEILVSHVLRSGKRVERHGWNRLPSGFTLDLTRGQYAEDEVVFEEPSVQEPLVGRRSPERYALLKSRVLASLGLA